MTIDHRVPDAASEGSAIRKLNTEMSYIVSFFAAMNRPSTSMPVGQYNSSTTFEERLGLV